MLPRTTTLLTSEPCPPDYDSVLSRWGRKLKTSALRLTYAKDRKRIEAGKSLIKMAGGIPAPESLPVVGADFHLRDGSVINIGADQMAICASYGETEGYGPLRELLQEMQKCEHKPPLLTTSDHPVPFFLIISNGAQEALRSAIHCLVDEEDSALVASAVYSSTLQMLEMYGSTVAVSQDDQGMIPAHLEDILSNWELRHPGRRRPKLIYVITAGHNPCGHNWSEERVVDIYTICRKYNLIILEDGAYQYIQFGEQRNQSFQSVDIDGRVVRFDTMSKIIGAGYRIGWASGPKHLLERMARHHIHTSMSPNGLSQMLIYKILQQWGPDTFEQHVRQVAGLYKKKAAILEDAVQRHLTGLCTWHTPRGGMFLWLTIKGMDVTEEFTNLVHDHGLSIVDGSEFEPSHKSSSVRLSYSLVKEGEIEEAIKRLAEVIRECHGKQGCNGIN